MPPVKEQKIIKFKSREKSALFLKLITLSKTVFERSSERCFLIKSAFLIKKNTV